MAQLAFPGTGFKPAWKPSRRRAQVTVCRNRILFEPHERILSGCPQLVKSQLLSLCSQDARAVHLRDVVQVQVGDTVRIGVVGGLRAEVKVLTVHTTPATGTASRMDLEVTRTYGPLPSPSVDLLLALPRPKVLNRLWPILAELGLGSIVLCGAERVEKSFFTSKVLAPDKVHEGLVKGLEQAGDTRLPTIALSRTLKGALAMLPPHQQNETACPPKDTRKPLGELEGDGPQQRQRQQQQQVEEHQRAPSQLHARGQLKGAGSNDVQHGQQPKIVASLPWGVSYLCTGSHAAEDKSLIGSGPDVRVAKVLAHPLGASPALLEHVLAGLQSAANRPALTRKTGNERAVQENRVVVAIGPEGCTADVQEWKDRPRVNANAGKLHMHAKICNQITVIVRLLFCNVSPWPYVAKLHARYAYTALVILGVH